MGVLSLCKIVIFCCVSFTAVLTIEWPLQPKTYDKRPPEDSRCQKEAVPFCNSGTKSMPTMPSTDKLIVYILSTSDNASSSIRGTNEYVGMRYALGFHHIQSGLNMTLEWYEKHRLFNCTFAGVLPGNEPLWCNQGAACLSAGIDLTGWTQHGTVVKAAEISGDTFNKFSNWTEKDNATNPFVKTWTVMQGGGGKKIYFEPVDQAGWLSHALKALQSAGAQFNTSVTLKHTRVIIYSQEPVPMGAATDIRSRLEMANFFNLFQDFNSFESIAQWLLKHYTWFFFHRNFLLHLQRFILEVACAKTLHSVA